MASNNIKVVCRLRPLNASESKARAENVVSLLDDQSLSVRGSEPFTYDRVFTGDTRQEEVFEYGVRNIVDDVMNGYNGTVFAYGQTGSGKSHTMMGPDIDDADLKGIVPRISESIFAKIMSSPSNVEYIVKVSYMEIYMERIRDLLAPSNDNLTIHEDRSRGVYVRNLTSCYVSNTSDVYEIMRQGAQARATASTAMNTESSRSHSIFQINVVQHNVESGSQKSGALYLVDLAGSEKIGKTGASGQTLEEAKKINKSLSALGIVINALTDGKSTHIPYRDSKLTRILQESLGGNSRTTLIINCSQASTNESETLSTLRFGIRAKTIKNQARINTELSPAELKLLLRKSQAEQAHLLDLIARQDKELAQWRSGVSVDKSLWVTDKPPVAKPLSSEYEDELVRTRVSLAETKNHNTDLRNQMDLIRNEHAATAEAAELRTRLEKLEFELKESNMTVDSHLKTIASLRESQGQLISELSESYNKVRQPLAETDVNVDNNPPASKTSIKAQRVRDLMPPDYDASSSLHKKISSILVSFQTRAKNASAAGSSQDIDQVCASIIAETASQNTDVASQEKRLTETIQDLSGRYSELKRAFDITTRAIEGTDGKRISDAVAEIETASGSMARELRNLEQMKATLMRDVQVRCEQVVELEMALEEVNDNYQRLGYNTNAKNYKRKLDFLSRNVEQLARITTELTDQNKHLKHDISLAENKLAARAEHIENLEAELADLRDRLASDNASFEIQLASLVKRMNIDESDSLDLASSDPSPPSFKFANVVKPVRGGASNAASVPKALKSPSLQSSAGTSTMNAPRRSWFSPR